MKNKELETFKKGLENVSNFPSPKFTIAVTHNKIKIKRILQKRNEEISKLEGVDFKLYNEVAKRIDKDRMAICEIWARKDENNKPILNNNIYDIEDMEAFQEQCKKDLDTDQKILNAMDKIKKDFIEKWEEEESDISVYMLAEEFLPKEINATQTEGILWMVTELVQELRGESHLAAQQAAKIVPLKSKGSTKKPRR